MFTLLAVGTVAFSYLMPISLLIVGLLFLVTFSYRQTIRAYPQGGGSYIVAHANLGVDPGPGRRRRAADGLRPHRVGVSVSAGVFNLASAFPVLLHGHHGPAHRRLRSCWSWSSTCAGISESGTIFALPTYIFIGSVLLLVGVGIGRTLHRASRRRSPGVEADQGPRREHQPAAADARLRRRLLRDDRDRGDQPTGRRRSSRPSGRTPRRRWSTMAIVLGVVFLGISYLATRERRGARASTESVLSQIGRGRVRIDADLLRPDLLDDGHPGPGRPDQLRRLPAARLDPRPRRVHAAPVRVPRRAPGVQLRDRRAGR